MEPTCVHPACAEPVIPDVTLPLCLGHATAIWHRMHDVIDAQLDKPAGDRLATPRQLRTLRPEIKRATFNQWTLRGKLAPARHTPNGTPLYWLRDVDEAWRGDSAAPQPHDPVVYYLRTPSGRVKIGYTANLKRRLVQLRARAADVLAYEPGGRDVEARRHAEFADARVGRTEDFDVSDDLARHLATLDRDVSAILRAATRMSA